MMLADVGHGIEVRRREMADVEVDLEEPRHLHRGGKALGRGELVRIGEVRVPVHRDHHPMLLGKRLDPGRHIERGRRRDDLGAKRLRHLESAGDFGIGVSLIRTVVEAVDRNTRSVEAALDCAEVVEGRLEPPRADRVAAEPGGLHLRRPQLAFFQPAGGHRGNHGADAIAVGGARDIAEAVGLDAEPDTGRRRLRKCRVPLETKTCRGGQYPEFTSCQHVFLARLKPSRSTVAVYW